MNPALVHRSIRYMFLLVLLLLLAFLFWAVYILIIAPEDCAEWANASGKVVFSDPNCPVQVGDRVFSVSAQQPMMGENGTLPQKAGDLIFVQIERNGQRVQVGMPLAAPSLSTLIARFPPLIIAAIFWALALIVTIFSRDVPDRSTHVFTAYSLCLFLVLAAGNVSDLGFVLSGRLFVLGLIWTGPLAVHTHNGFLSQKPNWMKPGLVPALYLLSLLMIVFYGFEIFVGLPDPISFRYGLYAWLVFNWVIAVALTICGFRIEKRAENRRKIGTILLSVLAGFLPLMVFSILPDALFSTFIFPYPISLLFLVFLPAGYGYAIFRYRLIRLNRYVNRGLAAFLTVIIVSAMYMLLFAVVRVLVRPLDDSIAPFSVTNLGIVLLLLLVSQPIYQSIQRTVNFLFYGEAYDYRSAVQEANQTLDRASAPSALYQSIPEVIQKVLQLDCVWLFIPDSNRKLVPVGRSSVENHIMSPIVSSPVLDEVIRQVEINPSAAPKILFRRREDDWEGSPPCEHVRSCLMLNGKRGCNGVLMIGEKLGGAQLDGTDREILDSIARQASILLENARLITDLNQQIDERRSLYEKSMMAREEERRHLARELHDQVIQELTGINYAVSSLRPAASPGLDSGIRSVQEQVRCVMEDVRSICAGLRPPAMDSQGLVAALQSAARTIIKQESPVVVFSVHGNRDQEIPETVQMTLYRAFQEILQNILKHAGATRVHTVLRISTDHLMLMIEDDGKGFQVPARLDSFAHDQHFGLAGIQERVQMIQGQLKVDSQPGEGCRIFIRVPLSV